MEITVLSQKRGIMSLYDGCKYIIVSTHYGVVAESKKIERVSDDKGMEKAVHILFEICDWYGCWDLKSIIVRGVKKLETQFVEKRVDIGFEIQQDEAMYLKRRLIMATEKY